LADPLSYLAAIDDQGARKMAGQDLLEVREIRQRRARSAQPSRSRTGGAVTRATAIEADRVRAVGYVRVSTQDQALEGFSLRAQQRRIAAYCAAQGWDLVEVFADEGVSGGTTDRPAFLGMLGRVMDERIDKVVFLKLDRLGRCAWRMGEVRDRLEARGVGLVSITEQLDTSTSVGRLFWSLLAAFAEFERDVIRERAATGLEEKARSLQAAEAQGWVSGRPPYGYRSFGKALAPDPDESVVVKFIFRLAEKGAKNSTIARRLAEEGVPSPGGRVWTRQAVRRIRRNPVYAGRYLSLGEHPVAVEAIVEPAQWRRVQEHDHG
jgi:site-specific DNA recombinase